MRTQPMMLLFGLPAVGAALQMTGISAGVADYAGTFQGEELVVRLSVAPLGYTGTIQRLDKAFPCRARVVGDGLQGTFESEGHAFEFTARLEGATLILGSGGTTYRLARQAPAVNPLARPATNPPVKADGAAAAARGDAAANRAGLLRFKKVSIMDQPNMIGGEAFSFLAPVGWEVDGGVVWRVHPTMPAAVALRVRNPKGLEQLESFPTMAFSWGGLLPVTGFPQGSFYLGNEVQPPVRHATAYLKQRHLPRTRGHVSAKVVKTEELPKLAEAARAAEPTPPFGGPQMNFTAARVRIEFELEARPVEEDHYCVLNSMSLPGGDMVIEIADKLCALRAPKGKLDEATKIFETMIHSTRINLEWYSKYSQLVQALTRAQMDQIRAAGELSRYISRTSNEISDMMRQSYEERQAAQDRIHKNWSQYMRGVDEYRDPLAGRTVELPSGYRNAWVSRSGEYLVTDNVNFNPNVELGGTWQKLERQSP